MTDCRGNRFCLLHSEQASDLAELGPDAAGCRAEARRYIYTFTGCTCTGYTCTGYTYTGYTYTGYAYIGYTYTGAADGSIRSIQAKIRRSSGAVH
jgi:hypothetical protein